MRSKALLSLYLQYSPSKLEYCIYDKENNK